MQSHIKPEDLLKQSEQDFICSLAKQFPSETALLCGEVQQSPGITHELSSDFKESELPSGVLLAKGLLNNEKYDRRDFVELNRGFASAIALRYVLLGGEENYKAFIRGQAAFVALTRAQFDAMNKEYNSRLKTSDLKMAAIYMSAFNDVGKSVKLLKEASLINKQPVLDHDEANALIVNHPAKRAELLPGLDALDKEVRELICHSVGLDFNPSCFTQGEYPLYPVTQIANTLSKVSSDRREDLFSLIKIEAAMDVAGVRGHQAPGGAAYIKFVHPAFDLAFDQLAELAKQKSAKDVYLSYLDKNAQQFGLDEIKDQNEKIALTRIALMIRSNSSVDGKVVLEAFNHLKQEFSVMADFLINELATNNIDTTKSAIWMQYSPDLLRILTKENKSGQSPIEGLMLGLKIYYHVLKIAREQQVDDMPCYMTQGRELIPTVRKAATGDKSAMEMLISAAQGDLSVTDGIVNFQQKKIAAPSSSGIFAMSKMIIQSDTTVDLTPKSKI